MTSPYNTLTARHILVCAGLILAVTGCSSPEEKEARHLKRGNDYFMAGSYEKARLEYRNAIKLKPTDPEPLYRLGLIEEAQGNLKEAFGDFAAASQQDAHYHPALLKLAEYFTFGSHYDDAQEKIDSVLHDDPNDAGAHALHGAILSRQKNYQDAEAEALFALQKDPANIMATSLLASLYSKQNDDQKALATLDSGLGRNRNDLSLLILKANIYDKLNDAAKVEETYQAMFAIAPKESKYRVKLAMLQAKANHMDAAEKTLRDGVAALPDDWELRRQLVQFLGSQRSTDSAEQEIHKLINAFPNRAEPYTWLTDLYVSNNAIDRAEAAMNDALATAKTDKLKLSIQSMLARINYSEGKPDVAWQFAESTLKNDPNNLDSLFMRARIEADRGAYQSAIADLRTILRDQPRNAQALSILAEVLMRQKHIDLAIETLNQVTESDPQNVTARIRLAQLYSLNDNRRHAMDILFAVTKEQPKLSPAWETTARVAIDAHDFDTAAMAVGKLDEIEGQHNLASYLQAQLLDSQGRTDEAVKTYQSIIDLDPASRIADEALPALVQAMFHSNHLLEAITYLSGLKTKTTIAQTLLGNCYVETKQPARAATAYDAAIAAGSLQQDAYLSRAKLFMADHETDKAITVLEKAIVIAPADPRAAIFKAELLSETNREKDAIALYSDVLQRNPDLDVVANNLAELIADYDYSNAESLNKAKDVAERFSASTNPLLLDTLAWVYYRQGKMDQALGLMNRAAGTKADLPPQFHYHYGAILQATGNNAQAKTELQSALAKDIKYPGIEDAKALLSKL